jgi:hypothetical protein
MNQTTFGTTPLRRPRLWLTLSVVAIWLVCGGLSLISDPTRHTTGYILSVLAIIIAIFSFLLDNGVDRVAQIIGLIVGGLGLVLISTSMTGSLIHRLHAVLIAMTVVTVVALPCLLALMFAARKLNDRIGKPSNNSDSSSPTPSP